MKSGKTRQYELLLAGVIGARATSFIFSKIILETMSTFNLLAIRFLLAFLLMTILFHRRLLSITKREAKNGFIIGCFFFLMMACELIALTKADSSLVSLLENCSIIFVPLFGIFINKKMPGGVTVASALIAMAGVVFLAMSQGSISGGFTWGLVSAVVYAFAIIVTARLTHGEGNPLKMGIVQVGTMGIFSAVATFLVEKPHMPQGNAQWMMIALLVVVCTGFGFTLQPVAQSHVSEERAGIFCALSPAIATLLGVVVLHEKLGLFGVIGLLLILSSIVFPYINICNIFSKKG